MPFDNLDLITVTGTYKTMTAGGTLATGQVVFTPTTVLVDSIGDEIIYPAPFTAVLVAGSFSIQLPATNDPQLQPQGWTYRVQELINGTTASRDYLIQLSYATPGGAIDLADLVPVAALDPTLPSWVPVSVGINVRLYGATGNGVTNDTAAIAAAIAAAPAGSVVYFPAGVYKTDQIVVTKMLHFRGDGRYSSWLKPNSAAVTGLARFVVAAGAGGLNVYGASFEHLGIDLSAHPTSVGLYVGATTGWFVGEDIYVQGGAVAIQNVGTNSRFERLRLVDAGIFIRVQGDTGMELTLKDIDATRASAGTTTWGIEIIGTLAAGNGGDLRMDNVVINSAAAGGAVLSGGILMQYPGNVSIPVFANDVVIDNCAGPALYLDHVKDTRWNECWLNSAAGATSAVQITAGGNHQFAHTNLFGATGTYEFLGAVATAVFRSEANTCPSGPVYRFTGAGGWTDAVVDDIVPGAVALAQVTNDTVKFNAGLARRWGKWLYQQPQVIPPEDVKIVGGGGGAPAFQNAWAAIGGSIVFFYKGVDGEIYLSGTVTGGASGTVAFTLPAGYRPFGTEFFGAYGGTVQIDAAGQVLVTGATVAVSGITLRAAN